MAATSTPVGYFPSWLRWMDSLCSTRHACHVSMTDQQPGLGDETVSTKGPRFEILPRISVTATSVTPHWFFSWHGTWCWGNYMSHDARIASELHSKRRAGGRYAYCLALNVAGSAAACHCHEEYSFHCHEECSTFIVVVAQKAPPFSIVVVYTKRELKRMQRRIPTLRLSALPLVHDSRTHLYHRLIISPSPSSRLDFE
jgi:hypothetical protein